MQRQNPSKRYIYQGAATGVSATLTHPFSDVIPVHAASAIPAEGGYGHSRVEAFRYKEILSFSSAYTEVVGIEPATGVYETLALSVVEGLNVLDIVICDRIVGRVTAKFPGDRTPEPRPETSIVPIGSRFEGLRIGNTVYDVLELAPDFFSNPDFAFWTGLLNAAEGDEYQTMLQQISLPAADGNTVHLPDNGERPEIMGFCIAPSESTNRAVLPSPVVIPVPHFGTVHLGEFFCYPTSRNLTMLRVQLGCSVGGGVSVSSVAGGGRTYP